MTQIPRYRGVNGVRARLAGIAPDGPMPATRGLIRQMRCATATFDDQPASASYRARSGWLTVLSVARSYRSGSVIPRTEGTVLIRMADVGGATRPETLAPLHLGRRTSSWRRVSRATRFRYGISSSAAQSA